MVDPKEESDSGTNHQPFETTEYSEGRGSITIFSNMTDYRIVLTLDWIGTAGAVKYVTIQPGEEAEINFSGGKARICHKSDGGRYDVCPLDSPIAEGGQAYNLEQDGEFSG